MKTMQEAIEKMFNKTANDIQWWIKNENKSLQEAAELVFANSCIGKVGKQEIIKRVKNILSETEN